MPENDDVKIALARLQEQQTRDREVIVRLERNAEKTNDSVLSPTHSVNKILWTLGVLGAYTLVNQVGLLPALGKILAGAP